MSVDSNPHILGDIATLKYGKMPKKNLLGTGTFPTYSGYKYQDLYPEYNCEAGDVIVVARGVGGTGDVKIVREKCYLTNLSIKISLDNAIIDNKYFYYMFMSRNLRYLDSGSAQSQITINDLNLLQINLPSLSVQKRIVKILNDLDNKIALNTQTNQTLESIAQAIFKSWFVDFDPVRAKIAVLEAGGTFDQAELAAMSAISAKDEAALKQLQAEQPERYAELAQTAALFPSKMVDSELGEIPEGWEVKPLGDFLDVLETGSRPKGGVGGIKEGVPSVGAENIIGVGNYAYGKEKFVSREFFDKLKRGVIQDFDFLLYKDGGKPGEFKPRVSMFGCGFPYSEFAINEHVFRMRSEFLGQAFLYLQIGHRRVLEELANRGGKAAIPGINQTDVKTIPIVVPSNNEVLKHFNSITIKLIEGILKRASENNQLAQVRDALLPKLLSGELPIPEFDEVTA